jgi:hypothetical protein
LTTKAARHLRQRLPLCGPCDGTVRWHTHGLDTAVARRRAHRALPVGAWRPPWIQPRGFQERVDRIGGLVTITATATVLKDYAAYIYTITDHAHEGMAYAELDWPHGEVQIFRDSAAASPLPGWPARKSSPTCPCRYPRTASTH